jgi:hypothetical protein
MLIQNYSLFLILIGALEYYVHFTKYRQRNICLFLRGGFKEERQGRSPQGLHKTEIEFTDFSGTFASLKSRKVTLHFLVIIRIEKKKKENCHNLHLLLRRRAFIFWLPQGPHDCKSGLAFPTSVCHNILECFPTIQFFCSHFWRKNSTQDE